MDSGHAEGNITRTLATLFKSELYNSMRYLVYPMALKAFILSFLVVKCVGNHKILSKHQMLLHRRGLRLIHKPYLLPCICNT